MDPTALPTDNLYKFLALAGLALAGFCGWAIWRIAEAWHAAQAAQAEHWVVVAQMEARVQSLKERASGEKLRNEQFSLGSKEATNEATSVFYAELLRTTHADIKATDDAVAALTYDLATVKERYRINVERDGRLLRVAKALGILSAAGLLLSGFGFYLWQTRLQWYTDRQTKADFEDHMAEVAVKRAVRAKAAASASP